MDFTKLLLHTVDLLVELALASSWNLILELVSVCRQLDDLLLTVDKLNFHIFNQLVKVLVTLLGIGVA